MKLLQNKKYIMLYILVLAIFIILVFYYSYIIRIPLNTKELGGLGLILILIVGAGTAITALLKQVMNYLKRKDELKIDFKSSDGKKYSIDADNITSEEMEKLLKHFQKSRAERRKKKTKESGATHFEVILGIMPAVIALAFVGTSVYLMVLDKTVPDLLVNMLTTIIGYYFGMGASGALSEGKQLTRTDVQKILEMQERD